jgi:prolactin regulatory element-binding protein
LFTRINISFRGSHDGDFCAVDVKKMEVSHWSKKAHLGSPVTSIEFCPTERVVISTSNQWGAELTKLNVPADWKGMRYTPKCYLALLPRDMVL